MTQNLQRSLLLLIFVDGLTTVTCGSFLTLMVALHSFGLRSKWICYVYFYSFHSPLFIGVVTAAMVSVIRFISIQR
jgi:hypothetical protein